MTNTARLLKKIHNFIYKFGLDISFVKKEEIIDAIAYNTIENVDKFWKSKENKQLWDSPEYKEFYYSIIESLAPYNLPFDNSNWADIGCGSGTLLYLLKEKYKAESINGFEVAQSAIDIAQKRIPEGKFKVYDLYQEPEGKFDLIFCTEVLEHLLYPDVALKNLQKHMHEKSVLLITVPDGRKDTWGGHINYWSPESWRIFIENNINGKKFVTGKVLDRIVWALIYGTAYQK